MVSEATGSPQEAPKRRGRPKGSVSKNKASNELTGRHVASHMAGAWNFEPDVVRVKLASEHVADGLDSTIKACIIVGVSALPNGNASIITNIGVQQPFILVTVEPYADVVERLFHGLKKSGV